MKKQISLSLVLILIFSFCSSEGPNDVIERIAELEEKELLTSEEKEELEQLEKEVEKLEILYTY